MPIVDMVKLVMEHEPSALPLPVTSAIPIVDQVKPVLASRSWVFTCRHSGEAATLEDLKKGRIWPAEMWHFVKCHSCEESIIS